MSEKDKIKESCEKKKVFLDCFEKFSEVVEKPYILIEDYEKSEDDITKIQIIPITPKVFDLKFFETSVHFKCPSCLKRISYNENFYPILCKDHKNKDIFLHYCEKCAKELPTKAKEKITSRHVVCNYKLQEEYKEYEEFLKYRKEKAEKEKAT